MQRSFLIPYGTEKDALRQCTNLFDLAFIQVHTHMTIYKNVRNSVYTSWRSAWWANQQRNIHLLYVTCAEGQRWAKLEQHSYKICTTVTIPGSSLFCSAAPRHVDRDEELHVLVALPGEVIDGEQQHVRVGLGRGCYRVPVKQIKERLKGPKHEKLVAGIFTQIRPVWMGESESRPKTSKS